MPSGGLSVVHVASEMAPLAKVGGLADVVGALAREQARRGHRVTVVLPAYRTLALPEGWSRERLAGVDVPWGMGRERAGFERLRPPETDGAGSSLTVLLVEHAGERRFFDRPGIYDDPKSGEGWPDNAERFLFFARAALEGLKVLGAPVDVLHCHDQQAAWVPCFARTHEAAAAPFREVATAFTIHNLGYQGIYDSWILGLAGFPRELFYPSSPFEFWGRVNYMKVGLAFADVLSTVSPRYAQEIQSGGEFGFGLEGVLARRKDDLFGILNGIDDEVWNPASDPHLARRYDADCLPEKEANRAALMKECGFPAAARPPLVGIVSRLVEQKGFDLIEEAQPELARLDARWVVLGVGQSRFVDLFRAWHEAHPHRMHYRAGFDEGFAHRIEGSCDFFLMPSRYEPCGLNQMYSLRYGTVPVVRAVGGLDDTVRNFNARTGQGNGFKFDEYSPQALLNTLRWALGIFRDRAAWQRIQREGMTQDFSWDASARQYVKVYEQAIGRDDGIRKGQDLHRQQL